MTGLADCGEIRHSLGVYVVGAIDPAERATVDAHLSHCPDCREELAGLAGLPALLGRVPLQDAERLALGDEKLEEAPAELLDALLRQVASRRRARRWRAVAAAAAAAVIAVGGGIAGGVLIESPHGTQPPNVVAGDLARGWNPATNVGATVYYVAGRSGTGMQVQAMGIPDGTRCQLWVTTSAGQHIVAGQWTVVNAQDGTWYHAWSPASAGKVRAFSITTTSGKALVTIPAT